jgi:DNA-binding CsgD family transcriptional regulator
MARRGEEILSLAANGLTDKQIADQLKISVRTVESHWRRMREETGIPNRSGLLGAMLQERLERERAIFEEKIATLEREIKNFADREGEAKLLQTKFEDSVRERSRVLHEELSTLYDQVTKLKARQIEGEVLNAIVLKSSVLAYRIAYEAPHEILYMAESVRQFGYRPDDFTGGGAPLSVLVHPEDFSNIWAEAMLEFEKGRRMVDRRFRLIASNGDIRWVFERAVLELDVDDNPISIAAFVFDITHLGTDLADAPSPYSKSDGKSLA